MNVDDPLVQPGEKEREAVIEPDKPGNQDWIQDKG